MTADREDIQRLLAYAENALDSASRAEIDRRLGCEPDLRQELSSIRRLLEQLTPDLREGPSSDTCRHVESLLSGRPEVEPTSWIQSLTRRFAEIIFDSRRQPALGLRRSGGSANGHLLFRLDDLMIDLHISPPPPAEGGPWTLLGQVSPIEPDARWEAALRRTQAPSDPQFAEVDSRGCFAFKCRPGLHQVLIRIGLDQVVSIDSLQI